jgi:anti-repressor protein
MQEQDKGLQIFNFEGKQTRVVLINGEPWWVLKDVCDAVDLGSPHKVAERLDDDERNQIPVIDSIGRLQNTAIINESGLYNVILRSDKPEAKKFRKWITSEVLPAIRRTGTYMTPGKIEEVLSNPDTIIELATALKRERAKAEELETKIEEYQPKLLLAESLIASHASCSLGVFAKRLRQMGVKMGLNRFYARLRKEGYLMKQKSPKRHVPTQKAMELRLFELTTTITNDGDIHIDSSLKLTPKGQEYFIQKLIGERQKVIAAANQMTLPGLESQKSPALA